ncbi:MULTISPECIES: LysR family transcriptional regulator [unclassified Lysobacter]|uniref:LysR family transcriptional regulator n=1 Tax=unclassified Lysobacter TaxID=2635362 RepID=UPI0006F4B6EB|nr:MULTISPECIES: LysR family transcriptional regulator [unclassified Lysobacter]KQZ57804.1 LysR family transcriptional regulator [Lysobacter sp. Root559]KRC33956.1 LysR family transcriptional regulator [Lysobacter sp. Root76]KRD69290.1 LysR family transcriptional regulator [Lysobacter sp. Root96]
MLRLTLDALQILDAIDRRGSFAAAGKELHKVPSTISYTVAKLEDDLGVQVFERLGPKVALTAAGHELLREGRYLLKAAQDLEHRVRRVASGWETEFAIGIDSLFSVASLEEDMRAFYAVADRTRLRIAQETLTGTWESLLDRRVDLLIGAAGEGPSGGGYVAEPIGRVSFVFAVTPDHPLAKAVKPLGKAELQQHRAVVVADSARKLLPRTVGLLFGQDAITVPDMRSKYQLQRSGMGFGFLPEPYAREAIAAGELVVKAVEEPKPDETFYLAWRTGELGAALKWWIDRARSPGKLYDLLSLSCS